MCNICAKACFNYGMLQISDKETEADRQTLLCAKG